MLETLLITLIIGLFLALFFFVLKQFVQGEPLKVIGIILALIYLVIVLERLGVFSRI